MIKFGPEKMFQVYFLFTHIVDKMFHDYTLVVIYTALMVLIFNKLVFASQFIIRLDLQGSA